MIVHLPEFALIACGFGGTGGIHGVLVNLRQRKMVKDNLQLLAVFVFDVFQNRIQQPAGRTLIVAVLLEHHR
jgi:hypothetical protein